MPRKHRPADAQRFWDATFQIAYADALKRNGGRSDFNRIVWAAARADDALELRRRSIKEQQP
jgi:hypothetical protein